jgi:hypothetical protein
MTAMRRILITFFALTGIAALAAGGVGTALSWPAGPAAVGLLLMSATAGLLAIALAGRILYVLDQTSTDRVSHHDDR